MKNIFILLIFSNLYFSQQRIKIVDAENKEPIPYAKLIFIDKQSYRNTEENGEITLGSDEKNFTINAFGYEDLAVKQVQEIYFLHPKYKEIEEVEISLPKNKTQFKIGKIKREFPSNSFGASNNQWTVLNFFEYPNKDFQKLFIKNIKFLNEVINTKNSAIINLVIYKNDNGKPVNEPWKSYLVECKYGKHITEINLKDKNIPFPKEGIFIGFEWIINEKNSYQEKALMSNSEGKKELKKFQRMNPHIYYQNSEIDNVFILIDSHPDQYKFKSYNNKNHSLSIELTLSD